MDLKDNSGHLSGFLKRSDTYLYKGKKMGNCFSDCRWNNSFPHWKSYRCLLSISVCSWRDFSNDFIRCLIWTWFKF